MKKTNFYYLIATYVLMLSCLLLLTTVVYGSESVAKSQKFSVSPLNSQTRQPQSSYYNLTVTPNKKETLAIRIYNNDTKKIKVAVEANDGATNNNGITSYSGLEKPDESLAVRFSKITTIEQTEYVISPKSSVDVLINIKSPEKTFEGVILGGIRVTSIGEDIKKDSKNSAAVSNEIAYTVGVVLQENKRTISPKLNLNNVLLEQRNGRNFMSGQLQNPVARIVKKLDVSAKVYKKGGTDVIYEASRSGMRMAPNSHFNFGISLEDQPFKAGNYVMKIAATADGEKFNLEKSFHIKNKEAKDYNKNAVYVEKNHLDF